ncbi:MAG TPA: hypothetical protein PLC42_00730, partial [Parachlamydiaceae bacterium]|nr:hypothetical protein [Parachlamydiaceae bacterium]
MEAPVAAGSSSSSWRDSSCVNTAEKVCIWLPIPCLGLTALGGIGFGFSALFATSSSTSVVAATVTTQGSALASAAFDFSVTLVSLFSCGCYYKNMSQKSFEENVKRQGVENAKLSDLEKEIDKSVDALTLKNKELTESLRQAEEKAKLLIGELDQKATELLKSNDALKQTANQLDVIQKEFITAKKSLE